MIRRTHVVLSDQLVKEIDTLVEQQGHTLACCPINVTEVYAGIRPRQWPFTTSADASR